MLKIDGSQGEGGGQIIRSSLALAAVTGMPFSIENIRAKRKKPGLLKQHLTCVKAIGEVCDATVTGADLHSMSLVFQPEAVQTRGYRFSVGSAGSAILVAQTLLPALMVADGKSGFEITGGTHNMAAPPFDFLQRVYLPLVQRMGPAFESSITSYGFYPAGGGCIRIQIHPSPELRGLEIVERGGPAKPDVKALVSQIPADVGEREVRKIRNKFNWPPSSCSVIEIENSPGPGNAVMIGLRYPNLNQLFTGFGRRGVKAEQVAAKVCREVKSYLSHTAPVGEYLADQLMLPMAIAASQGKTSRFKTGPLSMHSRTHIDIIRLFLKIRIDINETSDNVSEVRFSPAG